LDLHQERYLQLVHRLESWLDQATKLLLGISHRLIPNDKVASIIASANDSVGVIPAVWG
jgi:hypothetical protein